MATKKKTITELRKSIFETFDEVAAGEPQVITRKDGEMIAMVPISQLDEMQEEIELHKNLAIGYAQALRGEGKTTSALRDKFKRKAKAMR